MFIELTQGSQKRTFNLDYITDISKTTHGLSGGCDLFLADGSKTEVDESYEQVKELIKREVAAERGY